MDANLYDRTVYNEIYYFTSHPCKYIIEMSYTVHCLIQYWLKQLMPNKTLEI